MSTNYTWRINQLDRNTSDGFVVTAHYTVVADNNGITASTYGTVGWTQSDQDFTPFEDLTEETVIGWVQDKLDKTVVETSLNDQITVLKNPPIVSGLPWDTTVPAQTV